MRSDKVGISTSIIGNSFNHRVLKKKNKTSWRGPYRKSSSTSSFRKKIIETESQRNFIKTHK